MTKIINADQQFGPSQFVVNPAPGIGNYSTVNEAVIAANAASGGTIYVQPGNYTENIVFPANVNFIGASTGNTVPAVTFSGNYTASSGPSSFQNIAFSASSGSTFGISGTANVSFTQCTINNSGGVGITATGGTLTMLNSVINASSVAANVSATNCNFTGSQFVSSLSNALQVNAGAVVTSAQNIFSATSGISVVVGAGATFNSSNSLYTANTFAIQFTGNGSVSTVNELINANDASGNAFNATGVFGTLAINNAAMSGSATEISPNITSILYPTSIFVKTIWSDVGVSQTLLTGSNSFSTATITLTLPTSPAQGDICAFANDSAGILTIQASPSQFIRIGNVISSSAGTAQTSSQGDSLTLVYRDVSQTWIATSVIGNWSI